MKKTLFSLLLTFITTLTADAIPHDSYENMKVGEITVDIQNGAPAQRDAVESVLTEMNLKQGDTFNQPEFDNDLKNLSKKYQIVDPVITKKNGKLNIHLNITVRPTIVKFTVQGSKYKTRKILAKGDLSVPMEYNRGKFYQSITDIRDFLIKRGYFKADVTYKIEETPGTGEAIAHIVINQGPLGHIHKIKFSGFTKKEKRAVLGMMQTSKFNILTNWIVGSGVVKEEEQERDALLVTHYIQTLGYIDAKVQFSIKSSKDDELTLYIDLDRGDLYRVGDVKVVGNTLESEEALDKVLTLKKGDAFNSEKVSAVQKNLQSLYTGKGYLDTNVGYELIPAKDHTYNIVFEIEESEKYKVGLIVVSGNKTTNNDVIYNNINITPGDDFNANKMKAAQYRLQSTGYFENVSVYAAKNEDLKSSDSNYRNIVVSLEEKRTGAIHLSAGANSTAKIFGELSMSENNFDIHGLTTMWTEGPRALRGGGQFADVKVMIGAQNKNASIKWVNPYINNSLWNFAVNISGGLDNDIANYDLYNVTGAISSTYPINPYFHGGVKFRVRDNIIRLHTSNSVINDKQRGNSGITSAGGLLFNYNTTNNPYVPSRGIKSSFETEFVGLVRNLEGLKDFPFLKFGFANAYYRPLWNNATLKVRGDLKFIQPLWTGTDNDIPFTERFTLGGVETVRGYAPGQVGSAYPFNPELDKNNNPKPYIRDPKGGVSSALFSVEVLQKVLPVLDVFAFFDTGCIEQDPFFLRNFNSSVGVGIRVNMGQPLPFVFGWGYPINPNEPDKNAPEGPNQQIQNVFFSLAGQF